MAQTSLYDRVLPFIELGLLLLASAHSFAIVLIETVFKKGDVLAPFLRMSQIRSEAFSRFWIEFSKARDQDTPSPAELHGSSALLPPLLASASGIVLDVGPGTGTQMPLFTSPDITAIYGAEPTESLHTDLRAKAKDCNLSSKYHIMCCGAETESLFPALDKAGLKNLGAGVFDTIICVRVLCSVPRPEETIRGLYTLLKPGGKMLVAEHVVNPWSSGNGSIMARLMQLFCTFLGWPIFMGSCNLDRNTLEALRKAAQDDGGWGSDNLVLSFEQTPLPYISGTLIKRR